MPTGCMREEKPEARAVTAEIVPTSGVTEAEEAAGMAVGRTIPVRYMITAVREAGRAAAVHRGRRDSGAEIRSAEA